MEYVEILRMRRSLIRHVGILAAIGSIVLAFGGQHASVDINGTSQLMSGMHVPLGALASIAAFYAAIFASSAGTSLNRENETRELSWTKPLSRSSLAVRFIAIDLVGVAIAYAAAIGVIAAVMTHMNIAPFIGDRAVPQLALGLGVGVMWYALIQVVTCMLPPGGRALSGVMWPVVFATGLFAQVPGVLGAIARALNVINPLSYLNLTSGAHGLLALGMPVEERALIVWGFTLLFCAISVAVWPKAEA